MADENASPNVPLGDADQPGEADPDFAKQLSNLKDIDGVALAVANIDQVQADRTHVGDSDALVSKAGEVKEWLTDADSWVEQAKGLKTIQFLVKECSAYKLDRFSEVYAMWAEGINGCIDNLRSALVKEACLTVMDVASECKSGFGVFGAQHFPSLLKVSASSKQVMAKSVLKCMKHLVELCPPDSLIACYKTLEKADAHQIRTAKGDCLLSLLQEHSREAIEPIIADVEDALVQVLQDSKPKTRQLGTSAFKMFVIKFPDRDDDVLDKLDPQTRKRLKPNAQGGLKQRMQNHMLKDYKGLFKMLDINDDGLVSVEEVMTTLKLSEEEATAFIKAGDENGDGYVEFDEFVKVMSAMNMGNSVVGLVGRLLTLKITVMSGRRSSRHPAPPEPERLLSLVSYEDRDKGPESARREQPERVPPVRESGEFDNAGEQEGGGALEMPPPPTPKHTHVEEKGGGGLDSNPASPEPQQPMDAKQEAVVPLAESHAESHVVPPAQAPEPLWSGPVLVRSGKFGGLCRRPKAWMEIRPTSVSVFRKQGQEPLEVLNFAEFVVSQKNVTVLMHPKAAGQQSFEFSFVSRNASNHFTKIREEFPDAH